MVGARNSSAAACRFARQLAYDLGQQGAVVVSGLARGIDSAAPDGSFETGTIGVVAGGLDVFYPPENRPRQEAMFERALVIAEMPPGTEPRARHFPYRNRIIAGLSLGTVVVEAAPKSGSLITARLAAEAGREVMAVPGSPLDPRAQGCNQLIGGRAGGGASDSAGLRVSASRLRARRAEVDGWRFGCARPRRRASRPVACSGRRGHPAVQRPERSGSDGIARARSRSGSTGMRAGRSVFGQLDEPNLSTPRYTRMREGKF